MENERAKSGEELLRTTATHVHELAGQIEDTLKRSKEKLRELQNTVVDTTKQAAQSADAYVHEKPWQAVGIAAGVGFLLGLLIRRD